MGIIEIKTIDELNYDVCEFILRNRLQNAVIHCPSSEILESLSLYMIEIGIPWNMEPSTIGISITKNYSIDTDVFHIVIILDKAHIPIYEKNENAIVFLIRDIEQEKISALVTDPETFDLSHIPFHLQNEEIRKMFLKTFIIAEKEIDIISPWMNFSVVNRALINLMRQALQRGVMIRIIYGLLPGSDEYNQLRSNRSDQVAKLLKESFSCFGDAFSVSRDNIHYKLVLCDEKYKLEGGFNYLSFTGDYSSPNVRREGSPFGRDIDEIRYLRKEYFHYDSME